MKTKALILTVLVSLSLNLLQAGPRTTIHSYNALPRSFFAPYMGSAAQQTMAFDPSVLPAEAALWRQKMELISQVQDPWRIVGGATNLIIGEGWQLFQGHVVQVVPNGILINGFYDPPLSDTYHGHEFGDLFFVEGFPFVVAEGDSLGHNQRMMAKLVGTYTYASVSGASTTVHKLVYGQVCAPPLPPQPTAEEIEAQRAHAEAKKAEAVDKVLKFHQDLATKGNPYGEYQMGLRYLKGDGIDRDLGKAREMFTRAAAQNQEEAAKELDKLPLR